MIETGTNGSCSSLRGGRVCQYFSVIASGLYRAWSSKNPSVVGVVVVVVVVVVAMDAVVVVVDIRLLELVDAAGASQDDVSLDGRQADPSQARR